MLPMKSRAKGFSLPELLAGLSVAAVVAGMATPSLQGMARGARVTAAHNELTGALNYARSQAVRRATPVAVCGSEDLRSCSARQDWNGGWIAFTDAAGEPGVIDGDDVLLRAWSGQGPSIEVRDLSAGDAAPSVRFSAAGQALPARMTRRLEIAPAPCSAGAAARLRILVEPAGSIRHERASCT
jgi:type IV fimbrial biogenesis protein FimT